jgi:hypothetical protein
MKKTAIEKLALKFINSDIDLRNHPNYLINDSFGHEKISKLKKGFIMTVMKIYLMITEVILVNNYKFYSINDSIIWMQIV